MAPANHFRHALPRENSVESGRDGFHVHLIGIVVKMMGFEFGIFAREILESNQTCGERKDQKEIIREPLDKRYPERTIFSSNLWQYNVACGHSNRRCGSRAIETRGS